MFPGDPPIPPPPPHTHTHTHTHTVTSLQRLYERNVLKWSSSHTVRVLSDRCAPAFASGRVLPFLSWLEDIFTHYVHSCLPVSSGSLSLECKSSKPAATLHREAPASFSPSLLFSLSLSSLSLSLSPGWIHSTLRLLEHVWVFRMSLSFFLSQTCFMCK